MDVGRGVGRAQGLVPSMCQRVAELRLLGHRAKRRHGGGPQIQVAVTAGDNELGVAGLFCRTVSCDAAQAAVCSSASLWWEVARSNQNGCSVFCRRTHRPS